jgi:hypothetical protein
MNCGFIKMSLLLVSSHTEELVCLPKTGKFSNKYFIESTLGLLLGLNNQNFQNQNVFVNFI